MPKEKNIIRTYHLTGQLAMRIRSVSNENKNRVAGPDFEVCGAVSLMFQIYSYDIGESIRIHNLQERMSELMLPGAGLDFRRRSSRLYVRNPELSFLELSSISADVLHGFTRGFPSA